jgi:hypothetical protein
MAMTHPPSSANQANKVVVAFLDGRRAKGRVFNFSAIKESFDLFLPEEGPAIQSDRGSQGGSEGHFLRQGI